MSDVLVFSRFDNPNSLAVVSAIKSAYHVPVLMEMDDLPMEINIDSPAFQQYRRDTMMSNSGANAAYWSLKHIKLSDGVFTTNHYLKAKIQKLVPRKNVHIMPNCVDVKNFKKHKTKKTGLINIGWMGGSNHTNDLEVIKEPILYILKKFPNVRFNTFGFQPEWTKQEKHCIHHTWVTFDKYYEKLNSINLDIGVAPLVDNEFNRCKSNLRVLEYSAMGIPTVASRVVPFQDIRPNITGYLAKDKGEWVSHLSALITRSKLRERIGNNAYNTVKRNNNPDKWARYYHKIFNFYAVKYARSAKDLS